MTEQNPTQIDARELFTIIGEKEVALYVERARVAKAAEVVRLLQEKIAILESPATV